MSINFQVFEGFSIATKHFLLDQNIQQIIHTSTTWLCLACLVYVIILHIFRVIFFENDSFALSFLQICVCAAFVVLNWFTPFLPEMMAVLAQIAITIESFYFANRLHTKYISGIKYEINDVEGKVFVITGGSSGKLFHYLLIFIVTHPLLP